MVRSGEQRNKGREENSTTNIVRKENKINEIEL